MLGNAALVAMELPDDKIDGKSPDRIVFLIHSAPAVELWSQVKVNETDVAGTAETKVADPSTNFRMGAYHNIRSEPFDPRAKAGAVARTVVESRHALPEFIER